MSRPGSSIFDQGMLPRNHADAINAQASAEGERSAKIPRASGRKQACFTCRQRKKKCDGKSPACGLCVRAGSICLYSATMSINGLNQTGLHFSHPFAALSADLPANAALPLSHSRADQLYELLSPASLSRPASSSNYKASDGPTLGEPHPPPSVLEGNHDRQKRPFPFGNSSDQFFWAEHNFLGGINSDMEVPVSLPMTPPVGHTDLLNPVYALPESQVAVDLRTDAPPSKDQFHGLLAAFIEHYHSILPCLNQTQLHTRVATAYEELRRSPLYWVIAGCGAWQRREDRSRVGHWLQHACVLIDENIKHLHEPLETLQAQVYLIYQDYISAAMVEMWVKLGKACRFVSLLGWDRIDGKGKPSPYAPKAADEAEKEERRRVVWVLFLLDRAMSCMAGWPLGMDDRQFLTNYPIPESSYLHADFSTSGEPFSMNLATLARPSREVDVRGHIFRGYALIGRIMTYHNNLHEESMPSPAAMEFQELENALTQFHLLSCSASSHSERYSRDRFKETWLQILIQTCTILLYHPTVDNPVSENSPEEGDAALGFRRCVNAVRKMVARIQEDAMYSAESLMNPFLLPSYFLACRFLTIIWHENKATADKNSIDTLLMLVDRIAEFHGPLAAKYRKSILSDVSRDPDDIHQLRRGTGNYLSEDCGS